MAEFVIREATDADGPALLALLERIWSGYEGLAFDPADHPPFDSPAEAYLSRGGRLWVAARDGEPAGLLGLLPEAREGEFALSLICVEQASRGQGLAAAMLAGADAFAQASGGERLVAWIDTRLVDGVRFVERHGFVRDPGVKGRHDGSDALEAHFSREVGVGVGEAVSSPPSEARPAGGG